MEEPPEFLKKMERFADRLKSSAFKVKEQPMSAFGTRHGGFQRRMIAASFDTLLLTFTLFPFSIYLTNLMVGEVNMSILPLFQALEGVDDPVLRKEIIQQFFLDGSRLEYFNTNTSIQLVGLFIYCAVCWRYWSATPGKMLVRLVVVDEKTGGPLSFVQSFWRMVGYGIGSIVLCLGVIWIGFDKRRQGWHDKLAGSVVIVKPNKSPHKTDAKDEEGDE